MFFNKSINTKVKKIYFDGDSLFARGDANIENVMLSPRSAYSALTGVRPPMHSFAVSTRRISQLITEFETKIGQYLKSGDIVICNACTNSMNDLANPTLVYNDIIAYRDLIWAKDCKIIVATMTARNVGYAGIETDRLNYNILIRNNSNEFDGVADVGGLTEFNSIAATANTAYYNADLIHFTTAGYTLYGETFTPVIQSLL